jgi:hypothetical protein
LTQLVSKCQVEPMIDVSSNIYGPPNTERGMMCSTLPIERSLIEREMSPEKLPVRSPR